MAATDIGGRRSRWIALVRLVVTLICVAGMTLVAPPVGGEALDGATILARARATADAGGSRRAEFTLEVRAPTWSTERSGRFYKQMTGDGRNALIVFDAPAQIRGIKVLSRQPPIGLARQWLYVPSTHRARRIAAGESARNIFGSDFSASDLELRRAPLESRLLGREVRDGHDAFVVDITGQDGSGPVHEVVWIRTSDFRLVRREFHAAGVLRRVYSADDLQVIDGIATPVAMTVLDVAGGTRSRIRLTRVRYHADFDAALFAVQHLDSGIMPADADADTGALPQMRLP